MNEIIKNIESAQLKAEVPQFRVGDTVRVHALIKEGTRERVQIFEAWWWVSWCWPGDWW